MDYENIYKEYFDELLELVKESCFYNEDRLDDFYKNSGYLFDFCQKDYRTFKSIFETNMLRTESYIEKIFVKMLENSSIRFNYYPTEERFKRLAKTEQVKTRPFQVYVLESDLRIGYVFNQKEEIINMFNNGVLSNVDELRIVELQEITGDYYDIFINRKNKYYDTIKYITLKELFIKYFGEDEYNNLLGYIADFNDRAKEYMKFQIALIPTKKAIEKFKKEIIVPKITNKEELSTKVKDYTIGEDELSVINENYFEKENYKLLLSDNSFAVSFISSEWCYNLDQFSDCLDGTNIVAGYLKSVEQLLYYFVEKHKNAGYLIGKKSSNKKILFNDENMDAINTELYSLEKFVETYGKDLLIVLPKTKDGIIKKIKDWRKNYRNIGFHKETIKTDGTIQEIRDETILLYYLILGSFSVD